MYIIPSSKEQLIPIFIAKKKKLPRKMSSSHVHVKDVVLVTPSEPTPNQILKLSALDSQLFVRFTVEYLLVYKPHHALHRAATVENLKLALGHILVPYYPLAGRVRNRADGLGLEVICRAQGAVFIEATSDSTVCEFEVAPRRRTQWRKFLSLHVSDVLKGAPPLVVQLTWLSDGGAALAMGFNHCLCDGIGSGEFLNSFAELARGKRESNTELTPKPIWSRHLLDIPAFRPSLSNSMNHPEFKKVSDLCGFNSRFVQERLTPTSITFDRSRLNELKKLVEFKCTSFEVVAAHVWRSWAKALKLPPNQILKLVFSINIRQRVKPCLPSGYYGNAFVLGCAQTQNKNLVEEGLDYAAQLVKRAKERVGDDYVREVVKSVSGDRATVDSAGVMIMTQWSRLGLESVDFGIGRPVQVGPVCCDKYCVLLPVSDQTDAVKVNLAVPSSAVDQYLYFLRNTCTAISP